MSIKNSYSSTPNSSTSNWALGYKQLKDHHLASTRPIAIARLAVVQKVAFIEEK